MKTKLYSLVACLGAMSLAACVTSVSDDDGGGGFGNSGGSGNSGNTGNTGGADGGSGGSGGAAGGSGGAGGEAACIYCAEALSDDTSPICDQQAEDLLAALTDCICVTGCDAECGDNLCADPGTEPSADCTTCFTGVACQQELTDCSNDVN